MGVGGGLWSGHPPEAGRTPLTPLGAGSSLALKASSWSLVTRAEAANWALAWSRVLDTRPWEGRETKVMRGGEEYNVERRDRTKAGEKKEQER